MRDDQHEAFSETLSVPAAVLAAGLLAAGCGSSITSSIGGLPSRTAAGSRRDHGRAVHRVGDAERLLWHQLDLAVDPA
jgi:hypothetical protein